MFKLTLTDCNQHQLPNFRRPDHQQLHQISRVSGTSCWSLSEFFHFLPASHLQASSYQLISHSYPYLRFSISLLHLLKIIFHTRTIISSTKYIQRAHFSFVWPQLYQSFLQPIHPSIPTLLTNTIHRSQETFPIESGRRTKQAQPTLPASA